MGNKQKANFEPPVFDKTPEQADRIRGMLKKSFIFENIDDKNLEILVKAMHKVELKEGEKIITEKEDGNYLFVVDEGKLDCHKEGSTDVLETCVGGDTFGVITFQASEKYRKQLKEFLSKVPILST